MSAEDIEIPENMAGFFDARADGYDEYMRGFIFSDMTFAQFYGGLCTPIDATDKPLHILDLGCGTGLEIEMLLERVPNARIMGVDLSHNMLELLQNRYTSHMDQIRLVEDSFLTVPFGVQIYDYIISAMAIHHLLHDTKRTLYQKIHAALKPGGKYIEGDSVTRTDMENQFLIEFYEGLKLVPQEQEGFYHIDIPFSIDTQRTLLLKAGFRDFELLWQMDSSAVWNMAVYAVTK